MKDRFQSLGAQATSGLEGAQRPFASPVDVAHYLGGDRITCLLCAKSYKRLGFHLSSAHDLRSDEYKARFGLPPDCVLDCPSVRERLSAASLEAWRDPQTRERINTARSRAMSDPAIPERMAEGMRKIWEREGFQAKWAKARWGDPNFRAKQTPRKTSWRVAKAQRRRFEKGEST